MADNNLRIGVVGYCPPTVFDETEAKRMLREAYDLVARDFPKIKKTVVSGLTNVGVIKLAYEEAHRRKWRTAAITSKKAYEFKDNWYPVDEPPIFVGDNWGDESERFVNSLDILVKIGMGKQSTKEAKMARERGIKTYEFNLMAFPAEVKGKP
jgi:hypothetical protein